ncbi:MAG: hypothetical protein NTX29_01880 [Actinobacteria bacterium]|nr:hypothetical protein [Actinomycetota bacterium]
MYRQVSGRQWRPTPRRNGSVAFHVTAEVLWLAVLIALNAIPGWHAVPFLASSFGSVLWLVNLCIVARIVAHLFYLADGAGRFRPVGDYLIALLDLIVAAEILVVFPFDFGADGAPWETTARLLLMAVVVLSVGLRARPPGWLMWCRFIGSAPTRSSPCARVLGTGDRRPEAAPGEMVNERPFRPLLHPFLPDSGRNG